MKFSSQENFSIILLLFFFRIEAWKNSFSKFAILKNSKQLSRSDKSEKYVPLELHHFKDYTSYIWNSSIVELVETSLIRRRYDYPMYMQIIRCAERFKI